MQAKPLNEVEEHEEGELPQEQLLINEDHVNGENDVNEAINVNGQEFHEQVDEVLIQSTIVENGAKPLCRYFQRGFCRYSDSCRYSHDNGAPVSLPKFGLLLHPRSATPCRFFSKGYCRYGDACKFAHHNGIPGNGAGRFHPNGNGHLHHGGVNIENEWGFTGVEQSEVIVEETKTWDEDTQEDQMNPQEYS
ncbi:11858_t:CDS:1 [Ambispora gerdemannii]|uniref:11858_t:CDS:1 n=1 Tax=Ambispora gerdemannii TaxID=144530 RepID=A0A9N9DH84_9GLOM|nr:11858_t:CDS:1 [Ambispora gerdemannii]